MGCFVPARNHSRCKDSRCKGTQPISGNSVWWVLMFGLRNSWWVCLRTKMLGWPTWWQWYVCVRADFETVADMTSRKSDAHVKIYTHVFTCIYHSVNINVPFTCVNIPHIYHCVPAVGILAVLVWVLEGSPLTVLSSFYFTVGSTLW